MEEKKETRKDVREKIKNLYGWEKDYYGKKILTSLETEKIFQEAKNILLFWSLPDEIPTHDFIIKWSKEKNIYLPVVIGDDSEIRLFTNPDKMETGAFNIAEPVGKRFSNYEEIDLIIVPGMAFDLNGNRIGRGKGYYDKLLKHFSCPKIAICFSCQIYPSVPHEEWDQKVDKIITYYP